MWSTNTSMRIFTVPFPVLLGPVDFSKLGDSQACGKLRALQRERVSVRTRAEARLDKERVHAQRGLRDSPHETQMPGNGGADCTWHRRDRQVCGMQSPPQPRVTRSGRAVRTGSGRKPLPTAQGAKPARITKRAFGLKHTSFHLFDLLACPCPTWHYSDYSKSTHTTELQWKLRPAPKKTYHLSYCTTFFGGGSHL